MGGLIGCQKFGSIVKGIDTTGININNYTDNCYWIFTDVANSDIVNLPIKSDGILSAKSHFNASGTSILCEQRYSTLSGNVYTRVIWGSSIKDWKLIS